MVKKGKEKEYRFPESRNKKNLFSERFLPERRKAKED